MFSGYRKHTRKNKIYGTRLDTWIQKEIKWCKIAKCFMEQRNRLWHVLDHEVIRFLWLHWKPKDNALI